MHAFVPPLAFTPDDVDRAAAEWGANCGPGALAAVLGLTLDAVRPALPDFERRRYTNPRMMEAALLAVGVRLASDERLPTRDPLDFPLHGLVRIQFEGPWTEPGRNPRWAYGHTHWVASRVWWGALWVFDINAGWTSPADWTGRVVPMLTREVRRATGGWYATHRWSLDLRGAANFIEGDAP